MIKQILILHLILFISVTHAKEYFAAMVYTSKDCQGEPGSAAINVLNECILNEKLIKKNETHFEVKEYNQTTPNCAQGKKILFSF